MTTAATESNRRIPWHLRLEQVACPRCGEDDSVNVYTARDYIYGLPGEYFAASCRKCGLWFQNPRPAAQDLANLYPDSYAPHHPTSPAPKSRNASAPSQFVPATPDLFKAPTDSANGLIRKLTSPLRKQRWLKSAWKGWNNGHIVNGLGYKHLNGTTSAERFGTILGSLLSYSARWRAGCDLIPRFIPNGRILEIGCGFGGTLSQLRELGWRDLHGVELSESAADIARQLGFDVQSGTIESALANYPDESFDVIVSAMVLEHLLNPFAVTNLIATKLKPGGEFLFSTVIRDSLDGKIFGRYSVSYDFPRHMVFFRKRDLSQMLERDFEEVCAWHQSTPIDFQRPAYLRGSPFDRQIGRFFQIGMASRFVWLLAQFKLMGRVSYRCRRKYS